MSKGKLSLKGQCHSSQPYLRILLQKVGRDLKSLSLIFDFMGLVVPGLAGGSYLWGLMWGLPQPEDPCSLSACLDWGTLVVSESFTGGIS